VHFTLASPGWRLPQKGAIGILPFPRDGHLRDQLFPAHFGCLFDIQVQGLAKRLQFTGIQKVVIGVSGGLSLS